MIYGGPLPYLVRTLSAVEPFELGGDFSGRTGYSLAIVPKWLEFPH